MAPERLRFDYTQPEKPTNEDLERIENRVNAQVLLATPVQAQVRELEEARSQGFVALFGEKYGAEVRTLQVGDSSKELCGGTHVRNSGNIGAFRITAETAISAGTRRLEAVTGPAAAQLARSDRDQLAGLAGQLKIPVDQVATRVGELSTELKKLRKDLEKALAPDLDVELDKMRQQVAEHDGVHTVVFERPGMTTKDCQELAKRAQQALAPLAAVILSAASSGQVAVVASVSKDLTDKIAAGDLVKAVTGVLGGGGGGRPEMAQGKGSDAGRIAEALQAAQGSFREAGLAPAV